MRVTYKSALVAGTLIALSAASLAAFSAASLADRLRDDSTAESADVASPPPAVLLDIQNVEGVLGKEVRGAADENMGRIIDVVVDRAAQPRAAVIDFGGFLGVGSRKIAVDWSLLHFDTGNDGKSRISVELTSNQVRSVPEYKPGKPVVVTSGLVNLPSTVGSAQPD